MTRNPYDNQVATAYKASREIPRDGLTEWRDAVGRYVSEGTTLVDIGAGTGQFATAFTDWFGVHVVAVEPSHAMRSEIPQTIDARAGSATDLPLPDASADAAWLSLVIHHVPDLEVAAREIRRVLRPGAPVLIRQGFPGRLDGVEFVHWFPETARMVASYPTVESTCDAFAAAGFRRAALEPVRETVDGDLLPQLDTLRRADTTLRALTDEEFQRGKERVRRAGPGPRRNTLDLLVLR